MSAEHGHAEERAQASFVERIETAVLARGQWLALAESCTGGLVAATITTRPGVSRWFRGGVVAYSAAVKQTQLAVPAALIREHTPVSAEVVTAMARGACARLDADLAGAVSGAAGPGPDADGHPAGTVWIAVAERAGRAWTRRLTLSGDRTEIRAAATRELLAMLAEIAGGESGR